jgi:hypothetical protein
MDCQEFGRRSLWILKGNINCHLEYCKILLVNSLRFPDIISRRQRVLPPKKCWHLCCCCMFREMLMTQIFNFNFVRIMSWIILKQTHIKMLYTYILNKLYSLRSNCPSVALYFSSCSVHYIWPSTSSSFLAFWWNYI